MGKCNECGKEFLDKNLILWTRDVKDEEIKEEYAHELAEGEAIEEIITLCEYCWGIMCFARMKSGEHLIV